MGWWFYGLGCIISLAIEVMMAKFYWKESSKDEKLLTAIFWIPFTTAISWLGVFLFFFSALTHYGSAFDLDDKSNSDNNEKL